jgi:hypothetical protein
MADSSLIGVIVGGLIGIASGLIGPLVIDWRKQVAQEKIKRRDKYEQLVITLYENDHWVKTIYRIRIERSGEVHLAPPYAKIEAMLHAYFPDLDQIISPYIKLTEHYIGIIYIKSYRLLDARATLSDDDVNDLYKCRLEYGRRLTECLDLLREYAKREFQLDNGKEP